MLDMKSVVICGSRRFKSKIRSFARKLKENNIVVYEPYLHEGGGEWDKFSQQYKQFIALGLTHDHFYKIRMADVVFVYNKDGYSGFSTTLEIGYRKYRLLEGAADDHRAWQIYTRTWQPTLPPLGIFDRCGHSSHVLRCAANGFLRHGSLAYTDPLHQEQRRAGASKPTGRW